MKIHFTGLPLPGFTLPPAYELIAYGPEVPPFAVNALLVFPAGSLGGEEIETLRRSGRPVLHLAPAAAPEKAPELQDWLARLEDLPRTNYQPIDCNFYDNFEAAIVQRRTVNLEYRRADGSIKRIPTRLKDLITDRTEEYVQLENNEWLRLDRVVSVDGEAAGASCRF
jgi:transcriptional antiterminator Rof (Rho-off)